ncbi:hypothetical protein [Exiguobacterium sp.]|uniref:hypothetical protein n=1 Tax=Exiguobacterium sp. TaxID=44751 RepID=UPI0028ABB0FF|nr:hypothetical protein [Exiguobacterium sp.]
MIDIKILHVCLSCFYIDNHSYQENLLPRYHKKLGYEVEIIASQENFDSNGKKINEGNFKQYFNEDNIKVTRLEYKNRILSKRLKLYKNTKKYIYESKPDIIFVHGSQFLDLKVIREYREKHPSVKIYIDNHADFSNSAQTFLSRKILHGFIWRKNVNGIINLTEKFYGVLPARVDFLNQVYKIPKSKIDLLVMGADSDYINDLTLNNSHKIISLKNELIDRPNEFLIVTGGKIDNAKKEIFQLISTVKKMKDVKLVIFGSIIKELQKDFYTEIEHPQIKYVGWIQSVEAYKYFLAADLVIFPGRHSVLWEQAVGTGVPGIYKRWRGTEHININDNVIFLNDSSIETLKNIIDQLKDKENGKYSEIFNRSQEAKESFSYLNIAEKSINHKK